MHRATPFSTSFRAYSSGGARSVVDQADDKTAMQEMSGNFMKGETRDKVESPQNYGFTSVVRPADKGKDGQISDSAEAFISFLGGNRSFPVAAMMDDRRFRLKELKAGDVALFDWMQQQLHLNEKGVFLTGLKDKKIRFQLADPDKQEETGGGGGGGAQGKEGPEISALAESGGSSGGQQQGGGEKKKNGQKQRYEKKSEKYLDLNKDGIEVHHDQKIDYKTGTHTFHPPSSGAATRAGGPLVKILGDKFTQGFGEFTKQVTAAPPINANHLTTKGYVDAAIATLKSYVDAQIAAVIAMIPPAMRRMRATEDGGITIDGDVTFTGNLTVNGVVRAKGFETLP